MTVKLSDLENPLEKLPPQSLEAERALLGCILIDQEAMSRIVEILEEDDFYKPSHACIFGIALELYQKNEPIDVVVVSEILDDRGFLEGIGGRSQVNELALEVLTTENIEYYAEIIKGRSIRRAIIQAGYEIVCTGHEEEAPESAIDKAQQLLFKVVQKGSADELLHIQEILPVSFEQIEERHANKGTLMGVSSGFYDLDHYTSGFQKSDLIIIAARPSMGKTAFALNIATTVGLKEKKPVMICSLEMSKEAVVQRMLCAEAEIDAQRIRTGEITGQDFSKIAQAMSALGEASIFVDDSAEMTANTIRAKARKLSMQVGEIGVIIIDYLQLMHGSQQGKRNFNPVEEIAEISRALKGLARELKVPVIALSQLSRAVESRQDKKPMLSDLRQSGSIEQDADLVMFIYRDEYYNLETDRPGIADIIIAKQRNGPVGNVSLLFQNSITKFKNPADRKPRIF